MKKNKITALLLCSALLLPGCSKAKLNREKMQLPPNPSSFTTVYDTDQDETLITYNGRTYSYFGRLKGSMSKDSIRECLGFVDDDKDTRIYSLTEDPNDNYLMLRHTNGMMDQPEYLRATDTKNKSIFTPSYIKSGGYESWGSSGIHYEMPEVTIGLICNAESIISISYEVDINGESAFIGGVENADKSTIKKGELFNLDFNEIMFENNADVDKPFNISLTFTVTDNEGRDHEVKGTYTRNMMFGASLNDLEIREDGNGGYYLFEDI